MQLTHEEAKQLIQYNADEAVYGIKKEMLTRHLDECVQCQTYAQKFTAMETVLQGMMRKQWNKRPAPLSIDALMATKSLSKNKGTKLITRTALISVAFIAFIFIGWQITSTNKSGNGTYPGLLPIPTPSIQNTATLYQSPNCKEIRYKVQESDTLESIANHNATNKALIMSLNNLSTEAINSSMELIIPVCELTPTSTMHPPTFTITPILETISYTPG